MLLLLFYLFTWTIFIKVLIRCLKMYNLDKPPIEKQINVNMKVVKQLRRDANMDISLKLEKSGQCSNDSNVVGFHKNGNLSVP